jgi:hypothetical protein
LRDIVRNAIEQHLPRHQLEILKVAEQSEREQLRMFINKYRENGGGGDDQENGGPDGDPSDADANNEGDEEHDQDDASERF